MLTLNIYKDNNLVKQFTDQESDFPAFRYLLQAQPHSTDHALRYEGWKVEIIDQETGEKDYYKPYSRTT